MRRALCIDETLTFTYVFSDCLFFGSGVGKHGSMELHVPIAPSISVLVVQTNGAHDETREAPLKDAMGIIRNTERNDRLPFKATSKVGDPIVFFQSFLFPLAFERNGGEDIGRVGQTWKAQNSTSLVEQTPLQFKNPFPFTLTHQTSNTSNKVRNNNGKNKYESNYPRSSDGCHYSASGSPSLP